MPLRYDRSGIQFSYPENWTIDVAEGAEGYPTVAAYSPQGAFWSLSQHPASSDPDELATAALEALRQEYTDSESEAAREQIGGHLLSGYDLSFFYLDLTNTALIRGFRLNGCSCLLLCQAEDRDFRVLEPVFRAITTSLLAPS